MELSAMFATGTRNCASRLIEVGAILKAQLLASAAIVALVAGGPAFAADLPLKAPPPVVAAWNWSGFYIGGHGGYGWGRNSQTDINDPFFNGKFPGFGTTGFDPKGFLGGVHAGANWQSGSIVGGLEADLSFADIKGSSNNSAAINFGGGSVSSGRAALSGTFDLLGSGRGRLGYVISPNVLLYGTGGLAWTRYTENTDLSDLSAGPGFSFGEFSSTSTTTWRFGWVAGLGAEARLFDTNWLARLEYLHYDFGNSGSSSNPAAGLPAGTLATRGSGDLTMDVVRAGLSYKFDPDRVASYAPAASGGGLLYKAPAPVVAAWSWSGFYVGAHAGYGWARDPFDNQFFLDVVKLSGVDSRGFVGGFQTGANWQSGRVVGGLEIDLSGTDIKGSTSNSVAVPGILSQASQSDKFDRLGSARARIGYLATPSVLLYATGGPGWARMVTDNETVLTVPLATPPVTATSLVTPKWLFGWTAGAGVETRLWDSNWLARVEYLHYDFGSGGPSVQTVPAGPVAGLTSGHLTSDVVRAGLSYKLDWPGYAGGGPSAMPVKAAPAAVWSWTGFYIGGHGGYGWGRDPFTRLATAWEPAPIAPLQGPQTFLTGPNSAGSVGGFQAGANWQTGSIVGGLEVDLSGSDIKGSSSAAGLNTAGLPISVTQTDKFDLLGSARARLGYLVSPSILLYGTGGLAWTQLDQSVASTFGGSTTTTTTPSWKFGWTAGAGGQVRLWNSNWIARVEYLHYDFGDSGASFSGFTDTGVITFLTANMTSHHLTTDVVRAGVDYKLD
jgi:opacity protein-like surface antigen